RRGKNRAEGGGGRPLGGLRPVLKELPGGRKSAGRGGHRTVDPRAEVVDPAGAGLQLAADFLDHDRGREETVVVPPPFRPGGHRAVPDAVGGTAEAGFIAPGDALLLLRFV